MSSLSEQRMDDPFGRIGKAAKMIGMSIEGLRKWESAGILVPICTVANQRRYRVAD
jgi:DNA-binding transcriptional MerR regulator